MGIIDSIILFVIMAILAAIPSSSVALVVARTATLGVVNGIAVAIGIVLGDLAFIVLAVFGLSVIAETVGSLFAIIKVLGGIYLLWLGFLLIRAQSTTKNLVNQPISKSSLIASFFAGFILTLGDVKAIIFYASLLPLFIDLSVVEKSDVLTIMIITIFSVGGVKTIYAIFAVKFVNYARKANMEIIARRTVGGLMIGAGSYLIVKA